MSSVWTEVNLLGSKVCIPDKLTIFPEQTFMRNRFEQSRLFLLFKLWCWSSQIAYSRGSTLLPIILTAAMTGFAGQLSLPQGFCSSGPSFINRSYFFSDKRLKRSQNLWFIAAIDHEAEFGDLFAFFWTGEQSLIIDLKAYCYWISIEFRGTHLVGACREFTFVFVL